MAEGCYATAAECSCGGNRRVKEYTAHTFNQAREFLEASQAYLG